MVTQNPESAVSEPAAPAVEDDSEQRILLAALELVEQHGEANFRISDLVARSGRSVGSIYHFFGSREGVLEAVWVHQMTPWGVVDTESLLSLAESVTTVEEFEQAIVAIIRDIHRPERLEGLWSKVEVVAASRRRPALRRVVENTQLQMTEAFTEVVRRLQEKGLLHADVDAWALAVFAQAYTFGRILGQADGTDNYDLDKWAEVVRRTFFGGLAAPRSDT